MEATVEILRGGWRLSRILPVTGRVLCTAGYPESPGEGVGRVGQLRILITHSTQPLVKWVRPGADFEPRDFSFATRKKSFLFSACFCLLREDITVKPGLALNLKQFCPSSLSAGIISMYYYT